MIGATLSLYFAKRFLKTILAIFVTIFCLMFVIGFVELLRRTRDNPDVGTGMVALMSIMREPMRPSRSCLSPCFSRRWRPSSTSPASWSSSSPGRPASQSGILAPPVVVAFLLGVFSVGFYNPISATLKQRSDELEFQLFGVAGSVRLDHSLWLREHGVDGLAIIHAMNAAQGLTSLDSVSVDSYAPDGSFLERIEATHGQLLPGAWLLTGARVTMPGEATAAYDNYLLATDLTPGARQDDRASTGRAFLGLAGSDRTDAGRGPRRPRLYAAVPAPSGPAAAPRRHGPCSRFIFIKIFSIWRRRQDFSRVALRLGSCFISLRKSFPISEARGR